MGLAFTVDSPIKVARYGINSVISVIEDNLVEKMRKYYYSMIGETYHPISSKEEDYRARRITDYLNLVNRMVVHQVEELRKLPFEVGSDIYKYFRMLPDDSALKNKFNDMLLMEEGEEKAECQSQLRKAIRSGSIDVNIMTKLDKNNTDKAGNVIEDGSDAVTAMRGYAKSKLTNSSIILSAGMNPRLFSYMERLSELEANDQGVFEKKIVIKVSDYRSAFIQGRMLAKKGVWVSEYRIESGLNCGGHAFASAGYLLGPIMEEFKTQKAEMENTLFEIYNEALIAKGKPGLEQAPRFRITVQGGIGTGEENAFLHNYYGVDGTGWGTPFLLVPEATTVDDHTSLLLQKAKEGDVILSNNSPLGIPFNYLKGTSADLEKQARFDKGKPGSPCPEKFLISNTEFGEKPICTASNSFQKKKIAQLESMDLTAKEFTRQLQKVLDKECLCVGLSNAAINKYSLTPFKNLEAVNICPGPNIVYFTEVVTLEKMVDHIYGRDNILKCDNRPHMFIKELFLYVDYFSDLMEETRGQVSPKEKRYFTGFYEKMLSGISYYRELADDETNKIFPTKDSILAELDKAEKELKKIYEFHMAQFMQSV
jgi:hypothetical protein